LQKESSYIKLEIDEAYTSSTSTDISNIDIEIKTDKTEIEAWRTMSQIVTSYFDVIEITDRETGYLRTSWAVKGFMSGVGMLSAMRGGVDDKGNIVALGVCT
jgi:hypothetical protein